MLIKESQLRAIIRDELLREHQELMLEFSIKNFADNIPKAIPALILMLSANAMTACNVVDKLKANEDNKAQIAKLEVDLHGDYKKYNTEDLSSITDANKVQQTADEAIKDCEEGIKRLDKLGIDNPPIKGQLEKSITTLETLKSEVDEGFMPKDEVAAKKLVKAVSQNEKICKFFNDTLKNNVGQMGTQYITDAK
tara:strand:- start:481 stop:1065 length:585 start_codon:yes stop_codon:yes gene_type:complete